MYSVQMECRDTLSGVPLASLSLVAASMIVKRDAAISNSQILCLGGFGNSTGVLVPKGTRKVLQGSVSLSLLGLTPICP